MFTKTDETFVIGKGGRFVRFCLYLNLMYIRVFSF